MFLVLFPDVLAPSEPKVSIQAEPSFTYYISVYLDIYQVFDINRLLGMIEFFEFGRALPVSKIWKCLKNSAFLRLPNHCLFIPQTVVHYPQETV